MVWQTTSPKNILIKMPNWLGDIVMATPVLEDVRKHYPSAQITAMCQANAAPILALDPNIDELMSYVKPSGWVHRAQHGEIIQDLRKGEYDLGILLTNSFSSAYWFWRGNVKNRLGYASNLRSILLNKAPSFPDKKEVQHLVLTYKMLLEPLGIPLSDSEPHLYVTPEEMHAAKELLQVHKVPHDAITVGINPGAAFGSAKCWLPERFVSLTKKLLVNPKVHVLYFGDPSGAALVNDICQQIPDKRVTNLAGKTTLRELMSLINSCSLFLTNDSGPMHMAAALKIPLVALFGSTNDIKTGPYHFGKVIHKHVECSPCYKRVCPIDFRCMKKIEVDEVYNELQKLVQEIENV